MYPMEFKDSGAVQGLNDEKREVYSPGKAAGNPQSYQKQSPVDEIMAEGFGSSSVIQNRMSIAQGTWDKGEWSVIIARPLKRENGSVLTPGKDGFVAFAAWQGGKQEVGSRKSVTMGWVSLKVK
jgi:DMSO reductase family type II enzyme heme b subunit